MDAPVSLLTIRSRHGKALPMIIMMPNNQVVHRRDSKDTELAFPLFAE